MPIVGWEAVGIGPTDAVTNTTSPRMETDVEGLRILPTLALFWGLTPVQA